MSDHTEIWDGEEFGLPGWVLGIEVFNDGDSINAFVKAMPDPKPPCSLECVIEAWWADRAEHYLECRQADAEATQDDYRYHRQATGDR